MSFDVILLMALFERILYLMQVTNEIISVDNLNYDFTHFKMKLDTFLTEYKKWFKIRFGHSLDSLA